MALHHYTYYSFEEWGPGYIGVRSCDCLPEEDTGYFGSFADKEFSPTQKIIIRSDYKTREEANKDEIILHDFYDVARSPYFANRAKATCTGFCTAGQITPEETRQKLSKAHVGKTLTDEHKNKIGKAHSGKTHSDEHKQRNREARIGKRLTEKTKQKIGEANTGKKRTKEFKQRVCETQTGLRWFVNENNETCKNQTSPGPEWQPGRVWRQT